MVSDVQGISKSSNAPPRVWQSPRERQVIKNNCSEVFERGPFVRQSRADAPRARGGPDDDFLCVGGICKLEQSEGRGVRLSPANR